MSARQDTSRAGPRVSATVQHGNGTTTITFPIQRHPSFDYTHDKHGRLRYSIVIEDVISPVSFASLPAIDGPRSQNSITTSTPPTPPSDGNDARTSDSHDSSALTPLERALLDEVARLRENHKRSNVQMQEDLRVARASSNSLRTARNECMDIADTLIDQNGKLKEMLAQVIRNLKALQHSHSDLEKSLESSRETLQTQLDELTESRKKEIQMANWLRIELQRTDQDRQRLREAFRHHLCITNQQYALFGLQQHQFRHQGRGQGRISKPIKTLPQTGAMEWTRLNIDQRRRAANVWLFDVTAREIQSNQIVSPGIRPTEILSSSQGEDDANNHVSREDYCDSRPDVEVEPAPSVDAIMAANLFDYSRYGNGPWIFVARSDPLTAAKFMHEACYETDSEDAAPLVINFAERWSPRGFTSGDPRAKDYSLCLRSTLWWSLKREHDTRTSEFQPGEPKVEPEVEDHIYSPNILVLAKQPTEPLHNASRFHVQVLSPSPQTKPGGEMHPITGHLMPTVLENEMSSRIMRTLQLAQHRSHNIILPVYGGGLAASSARSPAIAVHTALTKVTRRSSSAKIVIAIPPSREFDSTWTAFEKEFQHDTDTTFCANETHLFVTMMEENAGSATLSLRDFWASMARSGIESVREWLSLRGPELLTKKRMTSQRMWEMLDFGAREYSF